MHIMATSPPHPRRSARVPSGHRYSSSNVVRKGDGPNVIKIHLSSACSSIDGEGGATRRDHAHTTRQQRHGPSHAVILPRLKCLCDCFGILKPESTCLFQLC